MPKRFYAAAQTGFSVHVSRGAGSCRREHQTTRTAGAPLRTGKTVCHTRGDCCCTIETTRGAVAGDCKNKFARRAVRNDSPA